MCVEGLDVLWIACLVINVNVWHWISSFGGQANMNIHFCSLFFRVLSELQQWGAVCVVFTYANKHNTHFLAALHVIYYTALHPRVRVGKVVKSDFTLRKFTCFSLRNRDFVAACVVDAPRLLLDHVRFFYTSYEADQERDKSAKQIYHTRQIFLMLVLLMSLAYCLTTWGFFLYNTRHIKGETKKGKRYTWKEVRDASTGRRKRSLPK